MPYYVCPITHTRWGTPDHPDALASIALPSIDDDIRSASKGLADRTTRAAKAASSNSDRKKIAKKLESICVLVRARHEKSRDVKDLDHAISLAAECLQYTQPTDPEAPQRHHTVASLRSARYFHLHAPDDLAASLEAYDAALQLSPANKPHKDVQDWMWEFSQALADRYEVDGDPADLTKAETMVRGALEMKGLDGTKLAERQSHLAYLLNYKTSIRAARGAVNPQDVLLTVGLAKQALARLEPNDPRRTMYRLRLATYLNTSFTHTNNSAHLDEAIAIFDDEFPELSDGPAPGPGAGRMTSPPLPTPPLSRASSGVSTASSSSAHTTTSPPATPTQSLLGSMREDPSKPYHLRALGANLLTRYSAKKNPEDLARANSCFRRALAAAGVDHPLWKELALALLDCNDLAGRKRVNIVISGGGPVGQTCALAMALQSVERSMMTGGPPVQITLYESRLMDDPSNPGMVRWRGASDTPPNTRRQQVITLQDAVIGNYDDSGVPWSKIVWNEVDNPEGGERVWPTSRQVPIRQVEDTITAYVQKDEFLKRTVKYVPGSMTAEVFDTIRPTCDLFIGADGAGPKSFAMNHPEFRFSRNTYFEEQMDRALGVFVDIPGTKRPQAKSVFLTISQTIYLLNSNYGTLGYLNIRLPGAYMSAMGDNETIESLAASESVLKRRAAFVIKGGLAMFDLPESAVKAINRIELPMSNSTRYLATAQRNPQANPREQPGPNATFPVVLAGDAAIKFNFWPGRGANSGLIGAYGLTTTLFDILPTIRPGQSIPVERFMLQVGLLSTLQVREHEGRGGYIQGINIDQRFEDVFGPHKSALAVEPQQSPLPTGGIIGNLVAGPAASSSKMNGPRDKGKRPLPTAPLNLPRSTTPETMDDSDDSNSPESPPLYTGGSKEMEAIVEMVNKKKALLTEEPAALDAVPLHEAHEMVRSATRRAKTRRGAPMSAKRKMTILEKAKPLALPESGFILDPREMEALIQYDPLITRELLNRLTTRRDTFEQRDDWMVNHVKVTNREFEQAVRKLHPALKKLIFLSEPWPTGKMNPQGWEVDPKIYRQPGIAR